MQNVEYKAELRDLESARQHCRIVGFERIGVLRQTDTYFRMTHGRLKRREAPGEPTEWIEYDRTDTVAPRISQYEIHSDAQARRRWGTQSLHPWLVVRKTRELWMHRNVRVHLDEVDALGCFFEIEAMLRDDATVASCERRVTELRESFLPLLGEPVAVSYADLMAQHLGLESSLDGS
ncbi:MAG: class IV adenylate cyclase [Planctomycetota bacterium]